MFFIVSLPTQYAAMTAIRFENWSPFEREFDRLTRKFRTLPEDLERLKNIIALGRESQQVYSWDVETPTTTPPVLVKDVNVTKPTA